MEMKQRIHISTKADKLRACLITVLAVALFLVCIVMLDLNLAKFAQRLGNAGNVLSHFLAIDLAKIPEAMSAMLASICIAFAALTVGAVISLLLSFFAASNIAPSRAVSVVIKSTMAIVRAVPALVWILMVVVSMGFGNVGGMVGLIFPTTGYLVKSFIASIENLGIHTIEAMRAAGANWLAIVMKGLLPSLGAPFVSWVAIRLEGNIAESINLGMVGVAGVGSLLMRAIGKYDYGAITAIILVMFATLALTELAINKLRRAISA
jgi:ABC-type phosphate/phosphonate transport system, permease component